MTNEIAQALQAKADEVATRFSNPNRNHNYSGELFSVLQIKPLSEHTAAVIYEKDSGKQAVAFFYWMPKQNEWWYFFPTDSHLLGMSQFPSIKAAIEQDNFMFNFKES